MRRHRTLIVPAGTPWENFPPYSSGSLDDAPRRISGDAWVVHGRYEKDTYKSTRDFPISVPVDYDWPHAKPTHNKYGEYAP